MGSALCSNLLENTTFDVKQGSDGHLRSPIVLVHMYVANVGGAKICE